MLTLPLPWCPLSFTLYFPKHHQGGVPRQPPRSPPWCLLSDFPVVTYIECCVLPWYKSIMSIVVHVTDTQLCLWLTLETTNKCIYPSMLSKILYDLMKRYMNCSLVQFVAKPSLMKCNLPYLLKYRNNSAQTAVTEQTNSNPTPSLLTFTLTTKSTKLVF